MFRFKPYFTNEIVKEMKGLSYSVLYDETTDTSNTKITAIVLRYYSPHLNEIITRYFKLVDCPGGRATGEAIFNLFISSLTTSGLDSKKIIGVITNSMVGEHNSVKSRFLNLNNKIFFSQCVCHSAALVASNACEELVRDVYNYFSHSPIRETNWKLLQEMSDINPNR